MSPRQPERPARRPVPPLVVAVATVLACSAVAAERATVTTEGMHIRPITTGAQAGKARAEQHFTFHLGDHRYGIRYTVVVDPKQPGKAFPSEGYVGMPVPCSCNWYHGGFLFVRVNGQDIGHTKLHRAYVAETGSRALADLVWDAEPAVVRLRFAGLPDDDKLLCEVAVEPKEEIRDLRLLLRCYPSFFTAWHKRDGDRKVTTPAATLSQGQAVELLAADHWWAVYYDTVFDVSRGEGEGPCAALFLPDAVDKVKLSIGSYAVTTELLCRPEARAIRLALWECPRAANEQVLRRFRRGAARWRKALAEFDFTPAAVRSFDPAAELAELDRLTRSAEVRRQLGARADGFRKRLRALVAARRKLSILQEMELLALLASYRDFLWDLKVAALLAD